MLRAIENKASVAYIPFQEGVTMRCASAVASAEADIYANWAEIMVRMTYGSLGVDPWTVVQNKIHPAIAEPEFTRLDLSDMRRLLNGKV
jgi:hypothetical protein